MKTIIVNNGSASKKYALYDGNIEIIFSHYEQTPDNFILTEICRGQEKEEKINQDVFSNSFSDFIKRLQENNLISDISEINKVAIRVVAPGKFFQQHRVVDKEYLFKLDEVSELSPLHIKPVKQELAKIKIVLPSVGIFAISDSEYHKTINQSARIYAFPKKMAEKLGLYRYGYHGLSVSSVVNEFTNKYGLLDKMIVCHLGGGSSITAIKSGQSFDTSMGFSPLEGIPMATRAGSADPNALISIMDSEDFDTKELQQFLYKECGLKGLSGTSGDTRVILDEASKGNVDAKNALDLYVYQIQKTIGSYYTVLGGLDVLIFTGTIGERSAEIRRRICDGLGVLGVSIDLGKNKLQIKGDGQISENGSKIRVNTIQTREVDEMLRIVNEMI